MKPAEIMNLAYKFVGEKHDITSKSMADFYKANRGDPEYVNFFVMGVEDCLRNELFNKIQSCYFFIYDHFEEPENYEKLDL